MSWSGVIPWSLMECMNMCKRHDAEGYTIHEQGCPVGKQIEEREQKERERTKDRISNSEEPSGVGES